MRRPSSPHAPRRHGAAASKGLVVAALVAIVAVGAGSLWYLATSGEPEDDGLSGGGDGEVVGPGLPRSGVRKPRAGAVQEEDEGDEDEGIEDSLLPVGKGGREPEGDVFEINEDSLRKVLRLRVWEELLRQIDEWEAKGKTVPRDVVESLLALLRDEGLRLDAVAALGRIHDDATGHALASLASDATAPESVRIAALDALSRSGQAAGVVAVMDLAKADLSGPLGRRAVFALAAMGGDAVPFLLGALDAHPDDETTDALVSALARAKGADGALAGSMRLARAEGDVRRIETLLRLATQSADRTGPELRAEVLQILRNLESVAWKADDEDSKARIYASAISVAAGMGGDAYRDVVRLATGPKSDVQGYAAYALSRGKGDEAAVALSSSLRPDMDPFVRSLVLQALGATGSKKATASLVSALDDADPGVRRSAAAGIAEGRDPAALEAVLARVGSAKGDFELARTYVDAIGRICVKKGLPKLEELQKDPDPFWRDLDPFVRRAVARIESGNPDAQRLK